jgi:NAD(P)-dependent dehydrogenase (short-subunit alcohol dehydrogenase family)
MTSSSRRVWLITGASSGFGRAIATAAREAGDIVVPAVRTKTDADQIELDVTDTGRIPHVVDEVVQRHGRIDVLVNNAGRAVIGAIEETTDAELRDLMDVHFFGPAALIRAVLPHMRERRSGAIVQMSSMGGQMSFPGAGAYSATKWALEGLSEALAGEVAPFGIRVLVVEPGAFRTGLHGSRMLMSAEHPAYAEIVGPVRRAQFDLDESSPGDPAKAAAAILAALEADRPPLRLVLGPDAVDAVLGHLDSVRSDVLAWESTGRATDATTSGK